VTAPAVQDKPSGVDDDPDVLHMVCPCDDTVALCGWDVVDTPWSEPGDFPWCVVCVNTPACPKCGNRWTDES
jgi:hypothetical protein